MPTQPVVVACNVKVMVSPFTAYVILYASSDENLVPEHESVYSRCTSSNYRFHIIQTLVKCILVCMLYKAHQCTPQQHPCCVSNSHQQRH